MLGVLRMNIEDCIKAFIAMMKKAFVRKNFSAMSITFKLHAKYDTAALEKCVADIIEGQGKAGHLLKDEAGRPDCRV